jgi:glutathione synthase/RimK-type ligase-like ATP-grasp enzyme
LIHFFYKPSQAYLKKFPVSIFEESFLRYDDEVVFRVFDERLMSGIGPRDSVFFYNMRYTAVPHICSMIETAGAKIINKPLLDGKLEMAEAFVRAGLPVPKHVTIKAGPVRRSALSQLNFPIIIKPIKGSSGGKGIYFCEKESELPKKVSTDMIVQEYIVEARDHIVRLNIVDDEPALCVKVFAENENPIINASSSGQPEGYTPTQEEVALAVAGSKVAGLDISGVDMAQTKGGPMIIEVNAVPGFTSGEKLGIRFHDFMVDLIIKRSREHKSLTLPT